MLYHSIRTERSKSSANVSPCYQTDHVDELNVTNPKQKDRVLLKIHIGFQIKGKTFGESNCEFAGL